MPSIYYSVLGFSREQNQQVGEGAGEKKAAGIMQRNCPPERKRKSPKSTCPCPLQGVSVATDAGSAGSLSDPQGVGQARWESGQGTAHYLMSAGEPRSHLTWQRPFGIYSQGPRRPVAMGAHVLLSVRRARRGRPGAGQGFRARSTAFRGGFPNLSCQVAAWTGVGWGGVRYG